MITEKGFALRHNAFWHRLLPMAPAYVRTLNLSTTSFGLPIPVTTSDNPGVTNELAFRLFASSAAQNCSPSELTAASLQSDVQESVRFIQRFRQYNRQPVDAPSPLGVAEARALATGIQQYFQSQHPQPPLVWPTFPGCGIVEECSGDAIADQTVVEVKCGTGLFRGRDVRQILCYAALNFAKKQWDLRRFCLVNPRRGVFFQDDIEHLCQQAGGASANDVLGDIVDYISEPFAKTDTA